MKVNITLEIRSLSGETLDQVEREALVNNQFSISAKINRPGEYLVVLTGRESSGFKVETPVARVRVRGLECRDRVVKLAELMDILEKSRDIVVEIKSTELKGLVKKHAVNYLRDLFEELGRSKLRVTGVIERKAIDEEVRIELRSTLSDIVSRLLVAIGVEDVNINVKISGLTIDLLRKPRLAGLLNIIQPIVALINLEVKECRSV